jgi:serine/threonine protein kinase
MHHHHHHHPKLLRLRVLKRTMSYLDVSETMELAKTIQKTKVPGEICQLGGPPFIQHFVSIARADPQHLPTLLALTFSGMATVHTPVTHAELVFEERIGTGVSANVFRGRWKGMEVAIKKYHHQLVNIQEVLNEVAFLSVLECKQVIKCLGASVTSPHLYLVTEYFSMGSIYDMLHGKRAEERKGALPWDQQTAVKIALDTAQGLAYLHSMNVCHRDIKSQNLLLRNDFSACIADLGISRLVGPKMTKAMGTPRYMAPEVISGKPYDIKADVYSFAILFWETLSGKMPYGEITNGWQIASAVTSGRRPPIDPSWHDSIKLLLEKSWHQDATLRPNFPEIIQELENIKKCVLPTTIKWTSGLASGSSSALGSSSSSASGAPPLATTSLIWAPAGVPGANNNNNNNNSNFGGVMESNILLGTPASRALRSATTLAVSSSLPSEIMSPLRDGL